MSPSESHPPITRKQVDALLRFLPLFQRPGRAFLDRWGGGGRDSDDDATMPYPVYAADVVAFFESAGQDCWSDGAYEPEAAAAMLADDARIESATMAQIRTMLTYCVRGERFSDGHWDDVLRSGRIVALLKRLQALRREM